MQKINILDDKGNKTKEISTSIFESPIREDIIQKMVEVEKEEDKQMYAPYAWAGMNTSASGSVKHNRHVWKTDRGKGMSRFPKKRMSDKGDRFVWMGAVAPGTKGGRRAHPPKVIRRDLKINKKERIFALKSGLALICSLDKIKNKYSSISNQNLPSSLKLPLIIDSKILSQKTKQIFTSMNNILGENLFNIALQVKATRSGIGKMRGRKYKKSAGMLLILGNKQEKKIPGIEIIKSNNLKLKNLAENGARLCMFTEEAVKDIENKLSRENKK